MKLKDYSDEEKQAVFEQFFGDTNVHFDDLTEKQLERIMHSFNGSKIVLRMRLREMWTIIKDIIRERKK
jgi:hypothetical protein